LATFSKEEINAITWAWWQFDEEYKGVVSNLSGLYKALGINSNSNNNGTVAFNAFLAELKKLPKGSIKASAPSSVSKTTTNSNAPKQTTTTASPPTSPQKNSFVAAKPAGSQSPQQTATSSGAASPKMVMGQKSATNICRRCGKTVYPLEALTAKDGTWHKLCFKCEEPGCSIVLSLTTFQLKNEKIYCKNHVPRDQATQVADMRTASAMAAPKLRMAQGVKKDNRMTFSSPQPPLRNGDQN